MRILTLIALTLLWPALALAQEPADFHQSVRAAVEETIRPSFADFAVQTSALSEEMQSFCAAPSETGLADVRGQFGEALAAWSAVEFLRFGPLTAENRLERIYFWPDPRGTGLRQIQSLLAEKDETARRAESLAGKSVALQGFPALEFVLFGDGLLDGQDNFRCDYGMAIAGNLSVMATELSGAWTDDSQAILNPGPDNPAYRDANESLLEIIQAMVTGLELMGEHKLRYILQESVDEARPRRTVFRRSANARNVLVRNIEGLVTLIDSLDFAPLLLERGSDARVVGSIEFELANARRTLDGIEGPVEQAASTEEGWGQLNFLAITLGSLRTSVGDRVTAELGLALGFNSLDGD